MSDDASLRLALITDISKNIVCGKTPSTKKSEYYGTEMLFVTIPDMHNQTIVLNSEKKLSELGAQSQKNKTLPKNSILVMEEGCENGILILN